MNEALEERQAHAGRQLVAIDFYDTPHCRVGSLLFRNLEPLIGIRLLPLSTTPIRGLSSISHAMPCAPRFLGNPMVVTCVASAAFLVFANTQS